MAQDQKFPVQQPSGPALSVPDLSRPRLSDPSTAARPAPPTAEALDRTIATLERTHGELQTLLRAEIAALRTALATAEAQVARLTQGSAAPAQAEGIAPEPPQVVADRAGPVARDLDTARRLGWSAVPRSGLPAAGELVRLVSESALFEAEWYLAQNRDLADSGIPCAEHYVRSGAFEGRNPGPAFDTMQYYLANPDVARAGWPALAHYVAFGRDEGRSLTWHAGQP